MPQENAFDIARLELDSYDSDTFIFDRFIRTNWTKPSLN